MIKDRSSNQITLSTAARPRNHRQTRPVLMLARAVAICSPVILLAVNRPVLAAVDFNTAIDTQLDGVTLFSGEFEPCVRLVGGDPNARDIDGVPKGFGPEITDICTRLSPQGSSGGVGASAQASAGGGATSVSPAVERRMQRLEEEEKGAGNSADAEVTLGSGFSVFLSADFEDLDRNQTTFEDGYHSDIGGVTLGADYLVKDSMVAGLAFNFNRWDGNFDTGGGFENDSYGAIAFASFLPLERLFMDVALGYARKDISEDRRRFYRRDLVPNINDPDTIIPQVFGGRTDSDRDDNEFSALLQLGYDYPMRQFMLGPRLTVDWRYTDIDGYEDKGNTGLELKYPSDSRTSFQTKLGLQASMAISTRFGVIVPQVNGDWVHEFADDRRSISVQFVQDLRPDPTRFSFDTNDPDRNFYQLGAGVVLVLPRGLQAFASVRILQEHEFLDSTAGSAGMRVEF